MISIIYKSIIQLKNYGIEKYENYNENQKSTYEKLKSIDTKNNNINIIILKKLFDRMP